MSHKFPFFLLPSLSDKEDISWDKKSLPSTFLSFKSLRLSPIRHIASMICFLRNQSEKFPVFCRSESYIFSVQIHCAPSDRMYPDFQPESHICAPLSLPYIKDFLSSAFSALNQFTQQINFILSALSGAERIFDMMDEAEDLWA